VNYETVHTRYEVRHTNEGPGFTHHEHDHDRRVQPLRVRKEWVTLPNGKRRFVATRITAVDFARSEEAPEPWQSMPMTARESLVAAGLVRGIDDTPYLPCGTPAEWSANVAANPYPPWCDPYEMGTE
jgi:hypothetical protein